MADVFPWSKLHTKLYFQVLFGNILSSATECPPLEACLRCILPVQMLLKLFKTSWSLWLHTRSPRILLGWGHHVIMLTGPPSIFKGRETRTVLSLTHEFWALNLRLEGGTIARCLESWFLMWPVPSPGGAQTRATSHSTPCGLSVEPGLAAGTSGCWGCLEGLRAPSAGVPVRMTRAAGLGPRCHSAPFCWLRACHERRSTFRGRGQLLFF